MLQGFYKIHTWLGLFSGVFMLVVSVTGALLMYSHNIERIQHPHLFSVAPMENPVIAVDDVIQITRAAYPNGMIKEVHIPREASQPYWMWVRDMDRDRLWKRVFVNPYTGEHLGSLAKPESIHRFLVVLHYQLQAGRWGALVVGFLGLTLVASCITGLFLYVRMFKTWWLRPIRWGARRRITYSDVHNFVGVTSLAFNLVIAVTGALIIYPMIVGFFQLDGKPPEPPYHFPPFAHSANALIAKAKTSFPEIEIDYVRFPERPELPIRIRGRLPDTWFQSGTVYFDFATADLVRIADPRTEGISAAAASLIHPLHFGEFGGWIVQLLYFIFGLTSGFLAITGSVLWWLRTRRKPLQSGAVTLANPKPIEAKLS